MTKDRRTPTEVGWLFQTASTREQFKQAEVEAGRLAPHDQLEIVDALLAAERRLGLK